MDDPFDLKLDVPVKVTYLTYNPDRDILNPSVYHENTCYTSLSELRDHKLQKHKEKYTMGQDAYNHYKWYNSCLKHECIKLDENKSKIKISHWSIESSNINAFKMNGISYEAISFIFAPTCEYWYCANRGPNSSSTFGSRVRCSPVDLCKKNNCNECTEGLKLEVTNVKTPSIYINNQLMFNNENPTKNNFEGSPVLKAIDLLNQKKSILRYGVNGSPKMQKNKFYERLKPIFEDGFD